MLERLGARIDPKSKLAALSIAERRLVVIARGLATNARLLVLDEPTASLSEEEITHLHDVVRTAAGRRRRDRLRHAPAAGGLRRDG